MTPTLTHGAFSWTELTTTDPKAAGVFYSKLLGWTLHDMDMGEFGTYTVVNVQGEGIGGIAGMPPQAKGMPPMWGSYITVDDVDKVAAQVPALGGQVLVPPMDIPTVGRFTTIRDPQGAVISLIKYLPRT